MDKKTYVIHFMVFALSAMILGIGTALFVKASLGADALSTFVMGIAHVTSIRVDQLIFVIMYGMMAVTLLMDKKKLGIASLIIVSYPMQKFNG